MGERIGLFLLSTHGPNVRDTLRRFRELMALIAVMPHPPEPPPPGQRPKPPRRTPRPGEHGIETPEGIAPDDLSEYIRQYFPEDEWENAARVSYYESGWRDDAENDTRWRVNGRCGERYWYSDEVGWADTEWSIGYFQINICAHGGDKAFWTDAENNVKEAADLFDAEGWRPWLVTARRLHLL